MPGKTAWCPSIRACRGCDCNVLCPRDPGTVLAETANQIDVLTFLEMGESSYAPILVGSDAEVCAVDVPVATYRMRVIPLFVKLLDGRRLIIPIGDAHCSGNNVRALRVLELPRKPCRADNRIRVGGGKPRRRERSATVGAERRESGGTRFSDTVVLCSNDVDAARDHFTRSVGAAVQDRDNPNGNIDPTRGLEQCVDAVREVDRFVVGGDYYKNLVDGHSDDPFLTHASRRVSSGADFQGNHMAAIIRALPAIRPRGERCLCETCLDRVWSSEEVGKPSRLAGPSVV